MKSEVVDITVRGMRGAEGAVQLERAIIQQLGVKATVSYSNEIAHIEYDPHVVSLSQIVQLIQQRGYQVPLQRIEIHIEGMSCASCGFGIEKALLALPGVKEATVNFATAKAVIQFNPEKANAEEILAAIVEAGYSASMKDHSQLTHNHRMHGDTHLMTLAICTLLTLPFLLQMLGELFGYREHIPLWIQAILATVVQFFGGWSFYRGSYHALKRNSANMDLLITLGTTAAYLFSLCVFLFRLPSPVYFESSTVIITLVLLGHWLESKSKAQASLAIEMLMRLQPKMAKVHRHGKWKYLPISEIVIGDVIVVRPGENIAIDGVVTEGHSTVNESMLTGESLPIEKNHGHHVYAGTTNLNGILTIKASKVGSSTVLASIIDMVERAQNSRAPIQRLADKISGIFVPIVLLASVLTFFAGIYFGLHASQALINMVAVLVIACPCALGLATPMVILVASGRAASSGILFKQASALEEAGKIQVIVFDKTGTLTEGHPVVKEIRTAPHISYDEVLLIAASLETNSQHPFAYAITTQANKKHISLKDVEDFESLPGKGIIGEIERYLCGIGSARWALERNIPLDMSYIEEAEGNGCQVVIVWREEKVLGYICIADKIRPSAHLAIKALHKMSIHTLMITGDNEKVAASIAREAGIEDYRARVLPEDKVMVVNEWRQKRYCVGMVGDGINDAPALATANVGFAIGAGTDIAMEASDVTLVRSNPLAVVEAIALSKAGMRKIKQNLFFAFIYNIIGIPLAASGMLSPIIAAAAMALSSLSVVGNALLLRHWKFDQK